MDRFSIIILLFITNLSACALVGYVNKKPYGYAEVYELVKGKYHIRLPYHVEGRGNIHSPFEYKKYEYDAAKWFVLDSITGVIILDSDARLGQCPFEEHRYLSSAVSGVLKFSESKLTLELAGEFSDFNGDYHLKFPEGSYKNAKHQSAFECSL